MDVDEIANWSNLYFKSQPYAGAAFQLFQFRGHYRNIHIYTMIKHDNSYLIQTVCSMSKVYYLKYPM